MSGERGTARRVGGIDGLCALAGHLDLGAGGPLAGVVAPGGVDQGW